MALTRTVIANMALGMVSSGKIEDIDSLTDPLAVKAKFWLEPCLREMGRRHWNCLAGRADVAQQAAGPEFGPDYKYKLPNDCLMVWKVNGYESYAPNGVWTGDAASAREPLWQVEGRYVLTDDEVCKMEYMKYLTDTTILDAGFVSTLATLMAHYMSTSILNDGGKKAMELMSLYKMRLSDARRADGGERNRPAANIFDKSKLLGYRRYGTRGRAAYGE